MHGMRLGPRLTIVGLIAIAGLVSPAAAQRDEGLLPPVDQKGDPSSMRSAEATSRSAGTPTREEQRAAALARGRRRFFGQVDEFGTDNGPPVPGPGVFPIGPNGMPTVNSVSKLRRR